MEPMTMLGAAATISKVIKDFSDTAQSIKALIGKKGDDISPEIIAELKTRIMEFLDIALEVKQAEYALTNANAALLEENRTLKEAIAKREQFEREKDDFEIRSLARHSYAMRRKQQPGDAAQISPYYCIPCFGQNQTSVLQFEQQNYDLDTLKCPRCEARVSVENGNEKVIMTVPRDRRLR